MSKVPISIICRMGVRIFPLLFGVGCADVPEGESPAGPTGHVASALELRDAPQFDLRDATLDVLPAGFEPELSPELWAFWATLPRRRVVDVDNVRLAEVAQAANGVAEFVIDNYTPYANEFCSADTLSDCPPREDPSISAEKHAHMYQFYQPDSCYARYGDRELSFSLPPRHRDHWLVGVFVYFDDLRSRALDLRVEGSELVLGIDFEEDGVEVRTNCIDNILCSAFNLNIELEGPRLELRFALEAHNGAVRYSRVAATFLSAGQPPEAVGAVESLLARDPAIRGLVNVALDALVRDAAEVDASCRLEAVAFVDETLQLEAVCNAEH